MRKTCTLALALLLAGMAAPAAEFEGHLMDTMCAATRLNQAAGQQQGKASAGATIGSGTTAHPTKS